MALHRGALFAILAVFTLSGCGGDGKDDLSKERLTSMAGGKLTEAVPVSGVVLLDGAPVENVYVTANKDSGDESVLRTCSTDKEGKFCFTTNLSCDGLEVGSYSLTFRLVTEKQKNGDPGPDQFKGKYKNPKKSEHKLTVEAGKPQTDVKIELKK